MLFEFSLTNIGRGSKWEREWIIVWSNGQIHLIVRGFLPGIADNQYTKWLPCCFVNILVIQQFGIFFINKSSACNYYYYYFSVLKILYFFLNPEWKLLLLFLLPFYLQCFSGTGHYFFATIQSSVGICHLQHLNAFWSLLCHLARTTVTSACHIWDLGGAADPNLGNIPEVGNRHLPCTNCGETCPFWSLASRCGSPVEDTWVCIPGESCWRRDNCLLRAAGRTQEQISSWAGRQEEILFYCLAPWHEESLFLYKESKYISSSPASDW